MIPYYFFENICIKLVIVNSMGNIRFLNKSLFSLIVRKEIGVQRSIIAARIGFY